MGINTVQPIASQYPSPNQYFYDAPLSDNPLVLSVVIITLPLLAVVV